MFVRLAHLLLVLLLALPGPFGAGAAARQGCAEAASCCCAPERVEGSGALLETDCCCEFGPPAPACPSPPAPQRDRQADDGPRPVILAAAAAEPPGEAAKPRFVGLRAPGPPRAPPLEILRRCCVLLC